MEWEIIYYSEVVQEEIQTFPAGIQARYVHLSERMMTYGANLQDTQKLKTRQKSNHHQPKVALKEK